MAALRAPRMFSSPDLVPQLQSLARCAIDESEVLRDLLLMRADLSAQVTWRSRSSMMPMRLFIRS